MASSDSPPVVPRGVSILHLEDDPLDAELIAATLAASDFSSHLTRVESRSGFEAALADRIHDLILADHNLPDYDGISALRTARERQPLTPVIMISGQLGEEEAVKCLQLGATDYVLKNHLGRLPAAVRRALLEAQEQRKRREAETALRESEARFRQMAATIDEVFWMSDVEIEEMVYVSPAYERIWGRTVESVLKNPRSFIDAIHPEDRAGVMAVIARQKDGRPFALEYRIIRPDGAVRWIWNRGYPLHSPVTGKLTHFTGAAQDVTERKEAEEKMRASEERFALVARAASDAIWDWNLVRGTLWWGGGVESLFGFGAGAGAPVSSWTDRIHPDDLARVMGGINAAIAGSATSWAAEYRFRRADGSYALVYDRGSILRDSGGRAVRMVGGMADWTARKQAENRFATVFHSSPIAIGYSDLAGRILDVNPQHCALCGYAREEMIGRTVEELQLWADPQERAAALQRRAAENGLRNAEAKLRTKTGEIRIVLLSIETVQFGAETALLAMMMDITERKALEQQLQRAHRIESVGRIASGIAHDLNNILAPIMMGAPLLRLALPPEQLETTLAAIESSAQRGAALVRQLLIFSRGMEGERRPVWPQDVIADVVKIVRQSFSRRVTISTACSRNIRPVHGDATQLHQVLLNLCVNARDAMQEGGTLALTAENVDIDAAGAEAHGDAKPGTYVCLRASDTGTGMAPEMLERIFDPFFTTKETGKGTGLGLSTVLGIVRSHGGFLRVRSEVGAGTTFDIYLPASPEQGVARSDPAVAVTPRGRGELVMVVDDEEQMRAVLRESLVRQNYKVVTAEDGIEATAVFAANREAVRLIVIDFDMPLIDGLHLGRVLRRMDSAVKIVISTGMMEQIEAEKRTGELDELGVTAVLKKPYTAEQILNVIAAALAEDEKG